jgi:DNA excision repair protein ERCC-2
MIDKEEILFPHAEIRNVQDSLISDVVDMIKNKGNLIVHAPTGLGKTAATLAPALAFALKNKLTVFFLTSRHTQHKLAIDTLKQIKKEHGKDVIVTDIIGKKWMCCQPAVEALYSNEFSEYCKSLREEGKCEFYSNTKNKSGLATVKTKMVLDEIKRLGPYHTEDVIAVCSKEKLCPYEVSIFLAKKSSVVVADYYCVFSPTIQQTFFQKAEKNLESSIIIVDEAHNLPKRCRELLTHKLTIFMAERAMKEAKKHGYDEAFESLNSIKNVLLDFANNMDGEEKIIKKQEFIDKINSIDEYEKLAADLESIGDEVREKQKQSLIGSIAGFLDNWLGEDEGYSRILSKTDKSVSLTYRCLDPSMITRDIIDNAHSIVLMSGTLTPTFMYKDILGFNEVTEREYNSPFPQKNKLSLVVPLTTTKFTKRSEKQYVDIAKITSSLVNSVPGNSAIFFPSYRLRDSVFQHFNYKCKKTILMEEPNLSKQEKQGLMGKFEEYKKHGAVLLGVASGSFGEGVDLPGDLLKAVIVVGLPLEKPNLETRELINYYDRKFGKGWDYGYIFPAITKTLQNAGRCIRSETDKGVTVFLDERYAWPSYLRCFPLDYGVRVSKDYEEEVKRFFHG